MNTPTNTEQLNAAATVLATMGIDPAELAEHLAGGGSAPAGLCKVTVAEFVPLVLDSLREGTRRAYAPPLRFIAEGWSVPAAEVAQVARLGKELGVHVDADPEAHPCCGPLPVDLRLKNPGTDGHRLLFPGWGDRALESLSEVELRVAARWIRLRAQHANAKRAARRKADWS